MTAAAEIGDTALDLGAAAETWEQPVSRLRGFVGLGFKIRVPMKGCCKGYYKGSFQGSVRVPLKVL